MWDRELADYRPRYPELGVLAALPPVIILDGELILLSQSLRDLDAIQGRHQLRLFLFAQDQTLAALAVRHHRLAAWGHGVWAAC
jgi:hypothetical protein